MKLFIDTSSNEIITVGLIINGKEISLSRKHEIKKAQIVLPLLDELLRKQRKSLRDINEIWVKCGPGSYTGLRVGVTIANTLGSILRVPINGKAAGELVETIYN